MTRPREAGAIVTEGFRTRGPSQRQRVPPFRVLESIQALEQTLNALSLSYTASPFLSQHEVRLDLSSRSELD